MEDYKYVSYVVRLCREKKYLVLNALFNIEFIDDNRYFNIVKYMNEYKLYEELLFIHKCESNTIQYPSEFIFYLYQNNYLKYFLNDRRVDLCHDSNILLKIACENSRSDLVKLLLLDDRINPGFDNNYPIIISSKLGNYETCKILLKDNRVDPTDQKNKAIKLACEYNKLDIIYLLLRDKRIKESLDKEELLKFIPKHSNQKQIYNTISNIYDMGYNNFQSLILEIRQNNIENVKKLILSLPSDILIYNNYEAFKLAIKNEYWLIYHLLNSAVKYVGSPL